MEPQTDYSLKGIKTFTGMDGIGINATLYRKGVRVAFILDEGCGGEMMYRFVTNEEETAFQEFAERWFEESGEAAKHDEEMAEVQSEKPNRELDVYMRKQAARDTWVNKLVDEHENDKRFKRLSKTKTIFRVEGDPPDEWRTYRGVYTDKIREGIENHFKGKKVEFWQPKVAA